MFIISRMKTTTALCALVLAAAVPALAAPQPDTFLTAGGPLKMTPIMHASFVLEGGGQVVYVDPAQGNYDNAPKADIIVITDIHGDHMVPAVVEKLMKENTIIVAPAAVQKTIAKATVLNNGQKMTAGHYAIEAVPMYNQKADDKGTIYHEKGRGNGYILTFGNLRIYVAGDTDGTPEMKALKDIDVAFIPMNLPYTMTPAAAAEAVRAFHPRYAYPYHYMGQDTKIFYDALENTSTDVRLRDWYSK